MTISRERVRVGAIVAVAAAVGFFAWLLLKDGDDSSPEGSDAVGPTEVSVAGLAKQARSIDTPVYWAGEIPKYKLEFTRTPSGRIFVRYLPSGVEIGAQRPEFLTVATYPQRNAYQAVRAAGERTSTRRIERGGLLVSSKGPSKSVHFSYPKAGYQVEVFSPIRGRSHKLVLAGRVQPVR
jgi:hypothetical protein